jgi:hypothetical protein
MFVTLEVQGELPGPKRPLLELARVAVFEPAHAGVRLNPSAQGGLRLAERDLARVRDGDETQLGA